MDSSLIKAIIISHNDGRLLVSVVNDETIDPALVAPFMSAILMFAGEQLGNLEEITIKGLDLEIMAVHKNELHLTAIFSREMIKVDIRKEAEEALNAFYNRYYDAIQCTNINLILFEEFEEKLREHIKEYMAYAKKHHKPPKKGFFRKMLNL